MPSICKQEVQPYFFGGGPHSFADWLKKNSNKIKTQWVLRLSDLSPFYRSSEKKELVGTVSRAFRANLEFISCGDLKKIKTFIDYITKKRLRKGFPLSDVQKAFELFRSIVVSMLREHNRLDLLADSSEAINSCLSYTIHRFSDHYQHMHELSISNYAKNLEHAISLRTAELAESQKLYKTLVEEINDGFFIIQNAKIVFANRAFCVMHRINQKKVIGRHFAEFVDPQSLKGLIESYLEILHGGTGHGPVQYRIAGDSNPNAIREVRARLFDLGHGPVLIGICRDISERVSMEAKIREHERLAYVGRLSASLSHEIRNPLSSIKMNLQILQRKLDLTGYDGRRLQICVQEVSRLEEILRQLLDSARLLALKKGPGNLSNITRECMVLLEPKFSEKNLKVSEKYSDDQNLVELDSARIQQAIINLLLNAIEASPNAGLIRIWTKIATNKTRRFLEFGVRDSGPGIPSDQEDKLFVPFTTSKSFGSGLGLSNTKRIIEAHGGSLVFKTRENQGATFIIRLPIDD
ncbi:MAG: nitrogen regulation protein NR(II) [Desulfomonilaceae bacterium]